MSSTGIEEEASPRPNIRLRDAMPRPLLVAFVILAVGTLVIVVVLMVKPPQPGAEPLASRHSPPTGARTHDVGRIAQAPAPSSVAPATCSALRSLRIEAGAAGQARLGAAIGDLCRLAAGGTSELLQRAIRGLDGATLRFAAFDRTAEEATTDLTTKALNVNLRFARSGTPTVLVAPVLVHEGYHLTGGRVTALGEYRARAAEFEACTLLVDRDKWIRNCEDAARIVALGEERSVELLVAAGYPR